MGLNSLLRGEVRLAVTGAFPEGLLNSLAAAGVNFRSAEHISAGEIRLSVPAAQESLTRELARKCGCEIERIRVSGSITARRRLSRRRVLIICAALVLAAFFASSLFVWDIRIDGNERLTRGRVLRALENAGVYPGAFWCGWSSDAIKNRVMLELPEIGWMGVSVSGSRAYISLRERTEAPVIRDENAPRDIEASASGIITELTVFEGTALKRPGDAVIEGETLISGVSADRQGGERRVCAEGRIIARTAYEITAAAPIEYGAYTGEPREGSGWALGAGKARIAPFGAGNIPENGRRFVELSDFSLEGVFTLPISLVHERILEYDVKLQEHDRTELRGRMEKELLSELTRRMDGRGEVNSVSFVSAERGGLLYVTLRADCTEDIARSVSIQEESNG